MHALLCAGFVTMAGCNQAPAPAQNPASAATAAAASSTAPAPAQTSAATQATPYTPPSADQLYQLVAPIALFPDNLVAQVLAGSTYPEQITAADNLLSQNPGLKGDALQAQVNPQPWDASVKALTTFPSVLDQMARNPQWTSALGEAYVNDPADVMNAIQVMRQRAAQKGNLRSNAQQVVQTQPVTTPAATEYADDDQGGAYYDGPSVVEAPPQTIEIMPAQQDTVYVPSYDPQTVYGGDVPAYPSYSYEEPRRYSTGEIVTAGAITFGAGILIGSLLDNHHHDGGGYNNPPQPSGGGWHSWGMNWGGRGQGGAQQRPAVIHNNTTYVSRSTTVVNRYTTNNINNSRTTINNVDNSRNQVVQNRDVGNRMVNNPSRPAVNAVPAATPHGAMSMPHFGKVPQQETVRTQQARLPAHEPNNLERTNTTAPHPVMPPHTEPVHVAVTEPNRAARPMPVAQPQQRETVRPMPQQHATPMARPAEAPHFAPRPAPTPHEAPPPHQAPPLREASPPRQAPPPRQPAAPAQRPHVEHPPAPPAHPNTDKHDKKDDKNEHS
ncbi:DUF3300 domain-containing protein [Rhodanobacter sp. C03]|uniref:DUF3300 domain-containing protein n=1 Tax=Rhodanobacter sp. C03 TaxID=1945858 RepID=UPI0009D5FA73|nr:DUF3300 domain-containing protein [Rhodanobacter sp. C03]OOG59900.1 hypothetical protein B0E48_03710 [Rhodanobacter sp. C03]